MFSKIALFKKPKTSLKTASQGFTLVESLMGIVVITVVAIAITPPIVISTATRVQNRRAEQAMQLAQAEVDRIRVFVEQGGAYTPKLPPVHSGTVTNGVISQVAAPTTFVNNATNINASRALADSSTKAFGVDVNNDAEVDYYVQIFRDNNANAIVANTPSNALSTFQMGVRVYSKAARTGSLQKEEASLRITNSSGGQQFKPLAVIYTTIASSDNATTSFERYRDYLKP